MKADRRKASAEDPEAQYALGVLYLNGEGVEKDYARAIDLFRSAARQGHAAAQRALGHMVEHGLGTPADPQDASRWYAKAAGQGDSGSMTALGYLAFLGSGIQKDTEGGIRWLRQAGEMGNAEAQMLLGVIYDTGWQVAEDDAAAFEWYTLAAEGGDPLAMFMRGCMHARGEGVALDIVRAAKDYRTAADLGIAEAEVVLGNRYFNLSGDNSMLKWKQRLIQDGSPYAREHLEKFFHLVEAYKGAALGDSEAMFTVGSFYWRGEGFERDFDQAVAWWRRAAELGNAKARSFLERIDGFENNRTSEKGSPMTQVGEKWLPASLVYDIGFSLLGGGWGSGEIHPSAAWMNSLRRNREAGGSGSEAVPPVIRNVLR